MRTYRSVVGAKGRVTIPAELRKRFGIETGTCATWMEEKGRLILASDDEATN
jgi:bifunctional DNA-binding transcriptional regulator/antitoxin component of YhaV-PrlF toxin-antitoxin module